MCELTHTNTYIPNTKPLINEQFNHFSNILKLYNQGYSTTRSNPTWKSQPHNSLSQTTSSSLSHNTHITQHSEKSELDSNSNTKELCIPDMNTVLLTFDIDTSKLRIMLLKSMRKKCYMTEVLTDNIGFPTISQRIKSMGRKAHYTKVMSDTH